MNDKKPGKPTSFDVAKRAGVHRSAVSRALSGKPGISKETRQKIIDAAGDLGYRVNCLARGLQNRASGLVGIVAPDPDTPLHSQQVHLIARELLLNGFTPILFAADGEDTGSSLASRMLSYSVSGMIVTSGSPPGSLLEECARYEIPVVLLNADADAPEADRIETDPQQAGTFALEMLQKGGSKNHLLVAPNTGSCSITGRADAFRSLCTEKGLNVADIGIRGLSYKSGFNAVSRLGRRLSDFDSVFCATDLIALGFLDAVRQQTGYAVPEKLQIIGFDNIDQAGWDGYSLSTVARNIELAAGGAVELIMARIEEPARPFVTHSIELIPVHRSTTRHTVAD